MGDDERTPRRGASERITRPIRSRDARDTGDSDRTRRRLIWLVGTTAMAGLADYSDGGGVEPSKTIATTTQSSGSAGSVPEAYATATSLGDTRRNPDSLSLQEAVSYQDEPSKNRQCSTCRYYTEDKNGDGVGACIIIADEIDPEGYYASYVEYGG